MSESPALGDGMSLVALADAPEFVQGFLALDDVWPPFMLHDPYGELLARAGGAFAGHALALVDSQGSVVGRALAVPVPWAIGDQLPRRGWDAAIEAAIESQLSRAPARSLCALEITLSPAVQGLRLSEAILGHMRDRAREDGLEALLAPVRPTGKTHAQAMPMKTYVREVRGDGLPTDPWLRIHVRLGAEICGIADLSMVIPGTFDDWRLWTGIDLDGVQAVVELEGGLSPLLVNRVDRTAAYIEPNVWCRHRLQ